MSKASERIKAALATNRIVIREEVKVLLGQYERLKTECDDLMALCEGINHALWLDPDASHDTDEAPEEIDAWRKVIERQRKIIGKLPKFADGPHVTAGAQHWIIMDGIARVRCPNIRWADLDDEDYDWSRVFSSREAAEAAETLAARSDDRERSATAATTPPTSRRYDV